MENKVYDDSFTIEKMRWGTYTSVGLDGKKLITSGCGKYHTLAVEAKRVALSLLNSNATIAS